LLFLIKNFAFCLLVKIKTLSLYRNQKINKMKKFKSICKLSDNGVTKIALYHIGEFNNDADAIAAIPIMEKNIMQLKAIDLSFSERISEKSDTILFYDFQHQLYYFVAAK